MIGKIKRKLREELAAGYGEQYRQELDASVVTYDAWIRERKKKQTTEKHKEEKISWDLMGEGNENTQKVNILSYVSLNLKVLESADTDQWLERPYVILADPETMLPEDSIRQIVDVFENHPGVEVVYGDEDEMNHEENVYLNPWLKPDPSPQTLLSFFSFGSLLAMRTPVFKEAAASLVRKAAERKEEKTDAMGRRVLYALVLEACRLKKREQIYHIKNMLSSSHNITYWGFEEEYEDIRQYYSALQERVSAEGVSIIIPSKDHPEILERCLSSVTRWTGEPSYEILVVDNGSSEENREKIIKLQKEYGFQYLYEPMEFNFSKMCNLGAAHARYDFLLFLNDDCEVRGSKWLAHMLSIARIRTVGAVGAKLYYPDSKKLQHCGIYNLHLGPVHKLQFKEDVRPYYDRRNLGVRNVLAVTAACLMVKKETFASLGGFEEELKVAFNDVDLCYRLYEAGYDNVVDNEIHLWHHESLSRGSDEEHEKLERLMREKQKLYERHPKLWGQDPYYHPWFTTQILDTGFSFAYEYDDSSQGNVEVPQLCPPLPKTTRIEPCVVPMLEYAGNLEGWFLDKDRVERIRERMQKKEVIYLQGNVVVLGSDNACYDKWLLLRHETSNALYRISPQWQYRPDILRNLPDQKNVGLSGFSCLADVSALPQGNYQIGVLVRDKISKQYLLRITTRSIENGRNEL